MKALLKNYHQSPRKVRLVASLVRGKKVATAISELNFLAKRASAPIRTLIMSAVANAQANNSVTAEDLYIKEITVNKGLMMKRFSPTARGRAFPIRKKMSHVMVVLAVGDGVKKSKKAEAAARQALMAEEKMEVEAKPAKKAVAKTARKTAVKKVAKKSTTKAKTTKE